MSRRNQVYLALRPDRAVVEKHFAGREDWERERRAYARLTGVVPVPAVYEVRPGYLALEHLPLPNFLEELERQERFGFARDPWEALAQWICRCHEQTGLRPEEGNLRNFLWDGGAGRVYGLDLEGFREGPLAPCGGALAAAVLDYAPAETDVKRRAAGILAAQLGASEAAVTAALADLRRRRAGRHRAALSGIILAGGASSRMGEDKAALRLGDRTLLEIQAEKMRALGIRDILLSGTDLPAAPGTRSIPDDTPGQGPLGGLAACLRWAENGACLVLSVDVPLVPENILTQMCRNHRGGVTVLRRGEKEEPLIGVYDRAVGETAGQMLARGQRSVQMLRAEVCWNDFDYLGPEALLRNCNTPEDLQAVRRLWASYEAVCGKKA